MRLLRELQEMQSELQVNTSEEVSMDSHGVTSRSIITSTKNKLVL